MFLLFASAYSSTPQPPSLSHVHHTFQRVSIAWVCEGNPGWYFVRPVHPERAPCLYKAGWYVHHANLHLVQWFDFNGLPGCNMPYEGVLAEVRHA